MDQEQAEINTEPDSTMARHSSDADDRIAARLKHLLDMPGISVKDRQLIERNLRRLLKAQEHRKKQ